MIKMTNVCQYCGEEWWDKHECVGTIRARLRKEAEAQRELDELREAAALKALERAENAMREQAEYDLNSALNKFWYGPIIGYPILEEETPLTDSTNTTVLGDIYTTIANSTGKVEITPGANDPVNSPKHYTSHPSGVECIDITKHYNFQIGNAMKYLWRQGLKDEKGLDTVEKQIQDCEKAMWYIRSYIVDLKGTK